AGVARFVAPFGRRWRLPRHGVRVLLDDGRGPLVVAYRLGRGSVIAALDEEAFTNGRIARGDNARLAVALALPRRHGAYVSFDEAPHGFIAAQHWWQIVPRAFVVALALVAFAFVIALAGAGIRLGPPLELALEGDGTSTDFIDAVAALLQRGRAFSHALSEAGHSALQVVARASGVPGDVPPEIAFEQPDAGAARKAYRLLLQTCTDPTCDERRFIDGVALAQRLRKEYAAHGSPRY
ncbi:MAG: hypothetical protein M3R44_05580, partial [Candidatus Eremiobacteraeota bacterium]|nr:hypothetical protein [Candidatus Eremiobacteraeota bacterium]